MFPGPIRDRQRLVDHLLRFPVPERAAGRLWEAATVADAGVLPSAPGAATARALVRAIDGAKLTALGASITDPALLAELVTKGRRRSFAIGAATNAALTAAAEAVIAARYPGLVASRAHARRTREGRYAALAAAGCTDEFQAGYLDGVDEAVALFRRPECAVGAQMRRVMLERMAPNDRSQAIRGLALDPEAGFDPWLLGAILDEIDAGRLDGDDVVARPATAAVAHAAAATGVIGSVRTVTLEPARTETPDPRRTRASRLLAGQAEMLALMGEDAAAARIALSVSGAVGAADAAAVAAGADVETLVDWLEGSLAHRPADDVVRAAVAGLDRDHRDEIAAEARRRPDPPAVLTLYLPGFAEHPINLSAAAVIWAEMRARLDDTGWEIAVGLLVDGWDDSVDALVTTVAELRAIGV